MNLNDVATMEGVLSMDLLQPKQKAQVIGYAVNAEDRLLEMGLIEGTPVEIEHIAPFGGSMAVRCRGTLLALRFETARTILVKVL